jgi:Zn-dependent M28 family amino/carboxypeptidase
MRYFKWPGSSLAVAVLLLISCESKKAKDKPGGGAKADISIPKFHADSALALVRKQVSFGPRIPNTPAHQATGDFIVARLKALGAVATVQQFQATAYDGQVLQLRNIIGSFRPEVQKRVVLAAHWDTRPFSDKDANAPRKPFDGANDGASGVAVLLELARHVSQAPDVGIDLVFFDGEDWAQPEGEAAPALPTGLDSWWCLGSQHWARHPHRPGYKAYYGILLDMVGGRDAKFFREGTSRFYAPKLVERVWSTAARLGYSSSFIAQDQEPITDDHLFVNELANIPMIDIVPYEPDYGYFGTFHHTQQDNLDIIDKTTLERVGTVVLDVIWREP